MKKYVALVHYSDVSEIRFINASSDLEALQNSIKEIICSGDLDRIEEYCDDKGGAIEELFNTEAKAIEELNNYDLIDEIIEVESEKPIYSC